MALDTSNLVELTMAIFDIESVSGNEAALADEVEKLLDICGGDLFEPLFEVYKVRIMSGNAKPQNTSRLQTQVDAYGTLSDRKSLYY